MILQALHDASFRFEKDERYLVPVMGKSVQKIVFKVVIEPDGKLFEIQDTRLIHEIKQKGGKVKTVKIPDQRYALGGAKPTGNGLNPCFLWDTTTYMLGFNPESDKPDRVQKCFESFREKHLSLESEINNKKFSAVCRFLENWDPADAVNCPFLSELKSGFGFFQIKGETSYIHEEPDIEKWWFDNQDTSDESVEGQCLITGEVSAIARLHPKIKGVAGSTTSSLVSFNKEAYESDNKKQGLNSPVSEEGVFRYASALNAMLDGPMKSKHKINIGGVTCAFWTSPSSDVEDVFKDMIYRSEFVDDEDAPENESVQDEETRGKMNIFLNAIREGKFSELNCDPEKTQFYLLGLTASDGRLSVRFFYNSTVGHFLKNMKLHFDNMRIERSFDNDPEFPSFYQILSRTCPIKKGKPDMENINPLFAGKLLDAVINGRKYPRSIVETILRRVRISRKVDHVTVSILKGFLLRNFREEVSVSLDRENKNVGYCLGRLLALFNKTQEDAITKCGKHKKSRKHRSVVHTCYSTAMSTPSAIYPKLFKMFERHMSQLPVPVEIVRSKLMAEIMAMVGGDFPTHLSTKNQCAFAAGFYLQKQEFYKKKSENPETKTVTES